MADDKTQDDKVELDDLFPDEVTMQEDDSSTREGTVVAEDKNEVGETLSAAGDSYEHSMQLAGNGETASAADSNN